MNKKVFNNSDLKTIRELQKNEIHIWCIQWHEIAVKIQCERCFLEKNEIVKADKFINDADKYRYLVGRILTKYLAAFYLSVQMENIIIKEDNFGKPYLKCKTKEINLQYNLSHSGAYLLLVFGYGMSLGVDVQEKIQLADYKDIAEHFFQKYEYQAICEDPTENTFFDIWTAKEAYVKAIGKGWSQDSDSFYIKNNNIYSLNEKLGNWRIYRFKLDRNYSVAIVMGEHLQKGD